METPALKKHCAIQFFKLNNGKEVKKTPCTYLLAIHENNPDCANCIIGNLFQNILKKLF